MADEPDNLVLELLRGIRAKLDDHDREFAAIRAENARAFAAINSHLDAHERILAGHTAALERIAVILADHGRTLSQHTQTLDGLLDIIAGMNGRVARIERHLGLVQA